MTKDLEKTEDKLPLADGFDGYEDGVEGDNQQQRRRVIQGTLIKFTNDFLWVTSDGDELPLDLELVVIDVLRVVQKWDLNDKPVGDPIVLEPGQRFPDIEAMNKAAPRSEWREKFGEMVGPWSWQHMIYLLDPETMNKFTFPTNSTGGCIAVRELVDRVQWMRKFRGARVYAVATLGKKWMNTAYGGRDRPHFVIKRWVQLDDDGNLLPPPSGPSLGGAVKEKPVEKKAAAAVGKPVAEPSYAEDLNDKIPF